MNAATVPANHLESDIAAYNKMREELESNHTGKWVLFHQGELVSLYESFEAAAEDAVRRFGRGPYLIRQIGGPRSRCQPR